MRRLVRVLRAFEPGTADRSCEGVAVQSSGRATWSGRSRPGRGPARRRSGWHGGPSRRRSAALLAASTQARAVDLGCRVAEPQSDAEVDQGAAQLDAAFARLITLSRRLPADSYWIGLSPGGAVDLPVVLANGPGHPARRRSSRPGPHPSPGRWSAVRTGSGAVAGPDGHWPGRPARRGRPAARGRRPGPPGQPRHRGSARRLGRPAPAGRRPVDGSADHGSRRTGRTGGAQGREPGRVGELGRDQPADLGGQHVRQRQGQTGEGPVQLPEQLVLRRRPAVTRRVRCAAHAVSSPEHQLTGQRPAGLARPAAARSSPAGRPRRS